MSRLIDADALLEEMIGITDGWREPRKDWKWYEDSVRNAPTIDAVPVVHGHWVLPSVCYEDIECSVCHAYMPLPISFDYRPMYKYCPMCGAKMDEVTI